METGASVKAPRGFGFRRLRYVFGAGIAVALAASLSAVVLAASSGISPSPTEVAITSPIVNPELGRTVTPAEVPPTISAETALSIADKAMASSKPNRILYAYVVWNDLPVWVISYQGGDICPPVLGPPGSSVADQCAGNTISARIDSTTGEWLDTFADGQAITPSLLGDYPLPSMEEVLFGEVAK